MQLDVPVIAILRGVEEGFFRELMPTAFGAGLQGMEVTFNTPDADDIISRCCSDVPAGKLLGMGTIRNREEAKRAADAGAMFLVTPNLDLKVIEYCRMRDIPVIAGAMTPSEVYAAWSAGAAMVKVFPCRALGGPQYIRDLRGPFEMIPLMAVGGVRMDNLAAYFEAGARAVGVGKSIFGDRAYAEKDLTEICENVKKFLNCCHTVQDAV